MGRDRRGGNAESKAKDEDGEESCLPLNIYSR